MKFKFTYLIALSLFTFSCGGEDENPVEENFEGTSSITISGDVSTNIDYSPEFIYTINSVSGSELSGLEIGIGNIGTTESAIILSLYELGNGQGYSTVAYTYNSDPDAAIIFNTYYVNATDSYFVNADAGLTNKLVLTSVSDTKITGEIELNLESLTSGAKIKLAGTFEAKGETFRLK